MQQQLSEIGIKINAAIDDAAVVFSEKFMTSKNAWDMFNFAWVGSPDPVGGNPSWMCDSDPSINPSKYCNPEVDKLLNQTDRTVRCPVSTLGTASMPVDDTVPVAAPGVVRPTSRSSSGRASAAADAATV